MVVITVEEPRRSKRVYRVPSGKSADHIIEELQKVAEPSKSSAEKPKTIDLSDVVGIWAYRKESAEEIARELRAKSNRMRSDG